MPMSVWRQEFPHAEAGAMTRLSLWCFSDRMWLASLIVAFWALNRLAMQTYSQTWTTKCTISRYLTLPRTTLGGVCSRRNREIWENGFRRHGGLFYGNEAALGRQLATKEYLAERVTHRVKEQSSADLVDHEHADPSGCPRPIQARVAAAFKTGSLSLATCTKAVSKTITCPASTGAHCCMRFVNQPA